MATSDKGQQARDEAAAKAAMDAELARKERERTADTTATGVAAAATPAGTQAEREAAAAQDKQRRVEAARQEQQERRRREDEAAKGSSDTPEGMGRKYEKKASGSATEHGKASATAAGGDPVHSPVIGNPGEARPDAGGYDYALAAAHRQPSQPLVSADVAGGPRRAAGTDDAKHPRRVVAIRRGEYNGIKEVGEEFDNSRNLPVYPDDPDAWFEEARAQSQPRRSAARDEKEQPQE